MAQKMIELACDAPKIRATRKAGGGGGSAWGAGPGGGGTFMVRTAGTQLTTRDMVSDQFGMLVPPGCLGEER